MKALLIVFAVLCAVLPLVASEGMTYSIFFSFADSLRINRLWRFRRLCELPPELRVQLHVVSDC